MIDGYIADLTLADLDGDGRKDVGGGSGGETRRLLFHNRNLI